MNEMPCRRRAIYQWRQQQEELERVRTIPTQDAAHLMAKSHVIAIDKPIIKKRGRPRK